MEIKRLGEKGVARRVISRETQTQKCMCGQSYNAIYEINIHKWSV